MNEIYRGALVFAKKGNLKSFYESKLVKAGPYALAEREIQCVVLFRWDKNNLFCRIKCPENPLPIKGEFQAPSLKVIAQWFINNEWKFKAKIPL
jgi:hypothetical protein